MRKFALNTERRARVYEIARYGMVGVSLVAIEYTIYLSLLEVRPNWVLSAFILSRVVASVVGFVAHSYFTFKTGELSAKSGLLYGLSVAGNMAIAALLLMATLPLLGPLFAKMVSDAIVIVVAYVFSRNVTFTSSK